MRPSVSMREHYPTLISLGPGNSSFSHPIGHLVRLEAENWAIPQVKMCTSHFAEVGGESGPAAAIKHCLGPQKVPRYLGRSYGGYC